MWRITGAAPEVMVYHSCRTYFCAYTPQTLLTGLFLLKERVLSYFCPFPSLTFPLERWDLDRCPLWKILDAVGC